MIDFGYGDIVDGCCTKCGHEMVEGDFPFCPHGVGGMNGRIHDDIPGGLRLENYGPHPVTVYSHTERRALMKAQGLQEKEKFCPMPGTDIDPQGIPNPKGYMDPQTLLNAAAIICRNGNTDTKLEFDSVASGVLRDLTVTVVDGEEAKRAVAHASQK